MQQQNQYCFSAASYVFEFCKINDRFIFHCNICMVCIDSGTQTKQEQEQNNSIRFEWCEMHT